MSAEHRLSLANLAVVLAAAMAMFTYAGGLANPAAAAETHYLALWATCVLLALAPLSLPPAFDLAGVAVLTTTIVWVVPHGPIRGATVGLLLTLAFAAIEIRYLERSPKQLTWTWAVATTLGLQFLCRADRFLDLAPDPKMLVGIFAVPLIAAATFMLLQEREGILPSLLAFMTAALLVPGWSVTVILSLLAVIAGILWRNRMVRRWLVVTLAVLLILAGDAWQPSLAWLLLLTILATAIPASWRTGFAAIVATTLLLIFLPAAREWSEVGRLMALGPILLPALLLPSDRHRASSIQAFVLAALALRTVAGPAALAAPLVLGALSLRPTAVAARFQLFWSGVLLAGVTLLGAYPWIRSPAIEDVLGLFAIEVSWPAAIMVVATLWLLSLVCASMVSRTESLQCRPVILGGLILATLAWIALPSPAERPFAGRIEVLDAAQPQVGIRLESISPTRSVVIDSYLENAASLPAGTPIARVILVSEDGEHRSWLLRAGLETAEWAARRADVAALTGFEAPPHWVAWVTADGDLMAQRYRAEWQLERSVAVSRVEIERISDLPDEVSLAVFHLELRR